MAADGEPVKVDLGPDIFEDDKADAGKVVSAYNGLPKDTLRSHPLLSLFKPAELDATMSSATSGNYHSYWNIDKISDLNDVVDASAGCPQKLKDIFAPGHSRNPRIRGNRIGQLIFDTIKEIAGSSSQSSAPVSAPAPAPTSTSTATAAAPAPQKLLGGRQLTQYVFSRDLPPEAQLRVREQPSMEGAVVGTVTADDTILGSPDVVSGEYLRVQIQGWSDEAWMLTQMGGQTLLVPITSIASEPKPVSSSAAAEPAYGAAAPVSAPVLQEQPPPVHSPGPVHTASPGRPMTAPMGNLMSASVGQPMMSASFRGGGGGGGGFGDTTLMGSNVGSMSMMLGQPEVSSMDGQSVPYEMYRRLEIRVNRLEQELMNLKMCLRSI